MPGDGRIHTGLARKAWYPTLMIPSDLMPFWLTLGRPLTRLLFAMCIGLLIANIV